MNDQIKKIPSSGGEYEINKKAQSAADDRLFTLMIISTQRMAI
jgi:hypothetical protein